MSDAYTKGFNEGYIIAAHLPEIAHGISTVGLSSPWLEGFRDGRKEYLLERTRELRPAWFEVDWNRNRTPDQPWERDRDVER